MARAAAPETPKLSLAYIPISNFLTAYVAKDQGYFTAHGLDVTLVPINQGNTGVAGIVSKSVELSTPTPTTEYDQPSRRSTGRAASFQG